MSSDETEPNRNDQPDLSHSSADTLAISAKSVLGAVPFVGSLMAEVVSAIIPNQRIDRIARLVNALAAKATEIERKLFEERLRTPAGVDLLEDAFHQAARATSEERIEYIANVLKAGITEEEAKIGDKKFLLGLLGQLTDPEVILLTWLTRKATLGRGDIREEQFRKKHWNVLEPKSAHMGSSREEIEESTLYEARRAHLVSLNLASPRFRRTIKKQLPEFDKRTGMLKASGYEATPLGRLLVRIIIPQGLHGV